MIKTVTIEAPHSRNPKWVVTAVDIRNRTVAIERFSGLWEAWAFAAKYSRMMR